MNVSDVAEPLSPDRRTILPVTRWVSVQFNLAVRRRQVETILVPLPCFQTISEAHVSERAAAFGQRIWSLRRIECSRAGMHFHTTMRSPADTW